jgi:Xaa-Pro aminopeptidase
MAELFFPREEYEARWQQANSALATSEFDTAVVWGRSGGAYERHGDVLWLTNYYSSQSGQLWDHLYTHKMGASFSAVILRRGEVPELIADEPPNRELLATERCVWSLKPVDAVVDAFRRSRTSGRVALVGTSVLPMSLWQHLEHAAPEIDWVPWDDLVFDLRLIKSSRELDAYRIAGETVTRGLTALMEKLMAGGSEAEAAGEAAREVVRRGGHIQMIGISHGEGLKYFASDPLVGYGHGTPRRGELARAWVYGPMFQGYWLDPGRTAVVGGQATPEQRRLIEATANIVDKCRAIIKPGVPVSDVCALGERLTHEFGGTQDEAMKKWPLLFGHGVGLFWDAPILTRYYAGKHKTIMKNMVLATEAFLSLPGPGLSAGFEDNFIVTDTGAELLTTTPTYWW